MPFQSKAQMRAAFAQDAEDRKHGREPRWNAKKWADHTPNIKDLPEHVKKANLSEEFHKIAVALMKEIPPNALRSTVFANSIENRIKNVAKAKATPPSPNHA
jgi:hypothetical protein